jgi:PAS domain S-box-containing protein
LKVVSHLLFSVRDRHGKVRSVVALVTDLTRRMQAERSREEIEARFQDMVARIADYLFSARVEQGSLKYEFCSPVIEKITGYPEEFFLNDNWFWFKIILLDDQQRVQDELLNLFTQRDDEGVIEYRIRARGGETRWLQSRFTILRNDKGKVERVIGAVSDAKKRRKRRCAKPSASSARWSKPCTSWWSRSTVRAGFHSPIARFIACWVTVTAPCSAKAFMITFTRNRPMRSRRFFKIS